MDQEQQIEAFEDDLDRLIQRYADEFDLTFAAAIGVMQMKIHRLCADAERILDEDGEDD